MGTGVFALHLFNFICGFPPFSNTGYNHASVTTTLVRPATILNKYYNLNDMSAGPRVSSARQVAGLSPRGSHGSRQGARPSTFPRGGLV